MKYQFKIVNHVTTISIKVEECVPTLSTIFVKKCVAYICKDPVYPIDGNQSSEIQSINRY